MMPAVSRTRSTEKRYYGVMEGIVTNVEDPTMQGRVKVKMPWFDEQMETEWCRVLQTSAGPGYGHFFIPEPGTEVMLCFVHGDVRFPVVMGGVYNGKDDSPSQRTKTRNEKVVRTKGGHEILLNDSKGEEQVRVKTKTGHVLNLSDKDKTITLQSAAGLLVEMKDGGSQITLKTQGVSVVMDPSGITLKAPKTTIDSPSIELGAGAFEQLIKGTTFLTLYNTHTHPTAAPGPPSPPTPPAPPSVLSTVAKTK